MTNDAREMSTDMRCMVLESRAVIKAGMNTKYVAASVKQAAVARQANIASLEGSFKKFQDASLTSDDVQKILDGTSS